MQRAENFTEYISAFEKELEHVAIDSISEEPYCKKYLFHLLEHKKYYLAIYADVLYKLVTHSSGDKSKITLVDYGSGNGLLGLFAKFCGFKKVILIDIDAKFIIASQQLSAQLNIPIDGYITGGIDALQLYCKSEIPDAITGTDVIEHIYDLEGFLSGLQQINSSIVSVFTTASNPVNFFKVRALKKIQMKDELVGGGPSDHILFGEVALEPFLKIRQQIISKKYNSLPDTELFALSKATRGMIEADIIKAAEQYHISKKLPAPAADSNTCNPLNGSWTERILSLDAYISLYSTVGFTCKFYAGFYNEYEGGAGAFVKKLLNASLNILGNRISPYIVIVGYRI